MKLVKKLPRLLLLATVCASVSACGQPERPRTVSDFCVVGKRISAEPDPNELAGVEPSTEDEASGNQFDTKQTFNEVMAHNEVWDRLCLG